MCTICGDDEHVAGASRRDFLKTGSVAALAPWMVGQAFAADPPKAGAPPAQNAISPEAALKRLMDGNARYVANTPEQKDFSVGRAARAAGQYPIAAILSCADSRVAPELAFDQNPGDLFVVRVAGNVITLSNDPVFSPGFPATQADFDRIFAVGTLLRILDTSNRYQIQQVTASSFGARTVTVLTMNRSCPLYRDSRTWNAAIRVMNSVTPSATQRLMSCLAAASCAASSWTGSANMGPISRRSCWPSMRPR